MKIKLTTAVLALAALTMAVPAMAATFWTEPFSYPDGDITVVSGGLWVRHSGGDGPYVVGQQMVLDLVNSGGGLNDGDVNRGFAARTATDVTYVCFQATVTGNAPSGGGTYIAHFRSSADFIYPGRIYLMSEPALTTFTFGIAATSSGTVTTPWPTALNFGQVYNLVCKYDASTGTSTLWIDPVTEASASISSTNAVAIGDIIDEYAFRQSGGVDFVNIDNCTVGETFNDVCGGATPTTTTSWGRVKALYR